MLQRKACVQELAPALEADVEHFVTPGATDGIHLGGSNCTCGTRPCGWQRGGRAMAQCRLVRRRVAASGLHGTSLWPTVTRMGS